MLVVHRDDGRPTAAAEALDGAERDPAVFGRLSDVDPELARERLDDLLRSRDGARDVRANLDGVTADGLDIEWPASTWVTSSKNVLVGSTTSPRAR